MRKHLYLLWILVSVVNGVTGVREMWGVDQQGVKTLSGESFLPQW